MNDIKLFVICPLERKLYFSITLMYRTAVSVFEFLRFTQNVILYIFVIMSNYGDNSIVRRSVAQPFVSLIMQNPKR